MKIIRYCDIKPEKRLDGRSIYTFIEHTFSSNTKSKFFRVKIPKGTIEEEHLHTGSDEIFIFLKPGKIIVNSETYNFEEGDIIILEKNERHKILAETEMELMGIKSPNINDKIIIKNENN